MVIKRLFIIVVLNNTPKMVAEQYKYCENCPEKGGRYHEENKDMLKNGS